MLYVPNPRQQARFEQQHTDASKSEGLIFAFFGFAAAYSAFEEPATSSATKRANSAWDSGQLCNVELWALVVCEGSTSSKTVFLRCRRGDQLLQFFKLSHVQLCALDVRGQDKAWFVLAADLFDIRSICSGTRTWGKFANLPSPN